MKCKITIQKSKIISNARIKNKYFKLCIHAPTIAMLVRPGQFMQLKVSESDGPLLRRPFSIHRVKKARVEILYEVIGYGTEILSQRKVGEYLDIIGPLGNGFDYGAPGTKHQAPLLVAGGMGVAPLLFLGEQLAKRHTPYVIADARVLIGAKTKNQILCEKEFKSLGYDVKIATDDGSRGFKGKITDLLKDFLPKSPLYACGPRPMLKEIAMLSKKYKISAQISLEEHMACGIGACLGCVVKTKSGYQRVCKEGPVFDAGQIIWEERK